MTSVAESIVGALARQGVTTVWGVVGDALNPVTDAIRRQEGIEWIGVRHEEAGAFAASAQAQLTGSLAVCMGTVGPGSIHLLLDVITNPDEVSLPPKVTPGDAWGFAVAKLSETLESR